MKPLKNYYKNVTTDGSTEIFNELTEASIELIHNYEGALIKSIVHDIPQVRSRVSLEY